MQALDVCKKESGKIWHRKPTPCDDGLEILISHTTTTAFSLQGRNIRFQRASFSNSSESFVAGDHQGNIYIFDLDKNRFHLVHKAGTPCTALAFSLRRKNEILVALADYSLKCYDTETGDLVSWMKGHDTSAVHSISLHASGRFALTSSNDIAQMWDLDTFSRKRTLNGAQTVGIQQVFYLPLSNTIMTCFKDDSIFAWDSETLQCKYQLPAPPGKQPHYRAFAASRDGRLLAAGGRSRFLHLWTLDTKQLLRVIQLPAKVRVIKQLDFVPDSFDGGSSQTLGVLSQDGIARFINIHTCKLLFDIGSHEEMINSMAISSSGRHVCVVMDTGCLHIYHIPTLTKQLNKPPPSLLKVVNEERRVSSRQSNASSASTGVVKERPLCRPRPGTTTIAAESRKTTRTTLRRPDVSASWSVPDSGLESELPEGLNSNRLISILKGYGEYPAKYRMFIWRSLLHLPENHTAYSSLVDKGTHSSYARIHEEFPIKSRKLLRVLQRTLSALAHWSPIFGETDFLPLLSFPFIKLFQNNHLISFEMIATVLTNWCQNWFEFFPNPPINVLGMVENVLCHHDKRLLQHFVRYEITSQMYAWPMLETLLSEVLTKDEWLRVWDNIFSSHPSFLLMFVVSYLICSRKALLQCTRKEDFEYFFHHRNALDIGEVVKETYRLQEGTPPDIHPKRMMEEFTPLTRGQYPVFNKYPKFIVDYQVKERERIRQDELEYLRQRQVALEMKKQTEQRQQEEEAFYRNQELMADAETQRRQMIVEEEKKLTEQRSRLQAMKREIHVKELQLLDAVRRKFLQHQQGQKQLELRRLDDEIDRKARLREEETKTAVEDAEIKGLELQAQKELLQQELLREQLKLSFKQHADIETHKKQQELEDHMFRRALEADKEIDLEDQRITQHELAQAQLHNRDLHMESELELRKRLDDLDRELKEVKLVQHHLEHKEQEHEIKSLIKDLENKENDESAVIATNLKRQKRAATEAERRRLAMMDMPKDPSELTSDERDQMFDRLRDIRQSPDSFSRDPLSQITNTSLTSDSMQTPSHMKVPSLERNRATFEKREMDLLADIRGLRSKLADRRSNPSYYAGASPV